MKFTPPSKSKIYTLTLDIHVIYKNVYIKRILCIFVVIINDIVVLLVKMY